MDDSRQPANLNVGYWPRIADGPEPGQIRPGAGVPGPGLSVRLCVRLLAGRGKDKLAQEQ